MYVTFERHAINFSPFRKHNIAWGTKSFAIVRTVYLLSVRVRQFISEFVVNLRKQSTFWRRYLWLTRETNEEIPY